MTLGYCPTLVPGLPIVWIKHFPEMLHFMLKVYCIPIFKAHHKISNFVKISEGQKYECAKIETCLQFILSIKTTLGQGESWSLFTGGL